jgi:hypothetical protein
MPTPEEQLQKMMAKLEADSGHPPDWWLDRVDESGLAKHGEKVAFLKSEHSLGHGYANALVHLATSRAEGDPGSDDVVDAQYHGKEQLRPIHDAVIAAVSGFGDDVEIAPKKTSVSLRRSKQFALIEPATKSRVDIGINLKGDEPTERLLAAGGMCTHKVRVSDVAEVDDELIGWLREAYERA